MTRVRASTRVLTHRAATSAPVPSATHSTPMAARVATWMSVQHGHTRVVRHVLTHLAATGVPVPTGTYSAANSALVGAAT